MRRLTLFWFPIPPAATSLCRAKQEHAGQAEKQEEAHCIGDEREQHARAVRRIAFLDTLRRQLARWA
jgi:hypothetical protein